MYTLKYFVFPYPVSSNWHTTFVACVCVVCSYLTHKGNADIQHSLLMFKTKLVLLLKSNASRRRPLSVTLPRVSPLTQNLLYKHLSFYCWYKLATMWLLIHVVRFLMSNCHACIFCVLYGVFELFINKKKIMFYLKDMFVWGTRGSFELDRVFFPCVWENVCACQNKKLHIFKSFLDQDCSHFFPPCKYFYSLCEVVFELMLCTSQCQK